ncbi:MAG TPA: LLM class F420-dependent oxidoreductase [Stellaceae bacterium]|jgi:probable F420-dependent oxidoreductase|nr:LLM class F420-dependent oxidoreductase [Stellaceae bacterium]
MQWGFGAPVSGPLSGARDLARIAQEGEALGFDYCTLSDHVVIPRELEAKYPYSDTGEFPGRAGGDRHEQLTAVTFVAAKTSKLRLVTSVMVVPHRPAVLTAKILATIDVLSEGRLTLGVGAGWCREEFEAIGTDPFAERGAVTDEYLLACRELWTNENPTFSGKYVNFSNIFFQPRPVQKRVPIWVGGESGPALRRTAKLGDGWYPIGTNPQFRLDTLERFKGGIDRLHRHCREQGRDPKEIAVAYRVSQRGPGVPEKADNGDRRLFSGSNDAIIGDLRAFKDIGIVAVDFSFDGANAGEVIANMKRLREDVLAKV